MHENHTHSIENRIVSLSQPWIRPIVRGKTHANTEFGVGKRSYGLNRIMAHLPKISFCIIGIALLCMNLAKSLKGILIALAEMWTDWCSWEQNEKIQLVTE